jgi:hypothetical protein
MQLIPRQVIRSFASEPAAPTIDTTQVSNWNHFVGRNESFFSYESSLLRFRVEFSGDGVSDRFGR